MDKAQAASFFDSLPSHLPRPTGIFDPEEAADRANEIRLELFSAWHRLRAVVISHEEVIQKRWKKRTTLKRKQLLQEIDPNLPKEHAPEIAALGHQSAILQGNRKDFALPYLNLEDLSVNNGAQFLCLLHWRAHEFPSRFMWFDDEMLHFGVRAGGIQRAHAIDCAMIAFGDEASYGKILEYCERVDDSDQNSPDGFQMEHHLRESISFGDGLAILETQKNLMNFLLGVVSKVLCDLDLSNLKPVPRSPLAAPAIPDSDTKFPWKSSARANALRPYGPPPSFSIDNIAVLLESQYELAVQHLADLRTDPTYLAEWIKAYYDHRLETIVGKAPPSLIQTRAVSFALSDAYTFLAHYHVAKTMIDEFRVIQARFPNGVARARELPPEYEEALKNFYPILICSKHISLSFYALAFPFAASTLTSRSTRRRLNLGRETNLYAYMTLLLKEDQTFLWELPRIFDQIDRITEDPNEYQRVSPLLANLLSHWAIVSDCKSILELHRPAVQDDEGQKGVQKLLHRWTPLLGPILEAKRPQTNIAEKAFPLSRFMYPKGPRSVEWARKGQGVDDGFAAFWKTADAHLVKWCGKELFALGTSVVAPFIGAPINWEELGTYAISYPRSRAYPRADKPKVAPRHENPPPTAGLPPFGGAVQSPATMEPAQVLKTKPKTRGVAAGEEDQRSEPAEKSVAAPTPVSTKVYKVFSALFTAANDEEIALQQSSVLWKDILIAFSQIAFTLEKIRGSAWTFRHPDGQRSITVHEPHPEPTMRFWEARRFGRRLTRSVHTAVSVNQHVEAFTWSPDSTRILYRLADSPDIESEALPISENIVSIQEKGGDLHFGFTHVMTHDRQLFLNSVWTEPGRFYFLHSEDYAAATPALWRCETTPGASPTRVAFGDTDDAAGLTSEDVFASWDIKKVNGKYIFVALRSSGVTAEVDNIWSGSTVPGTKGVLSTKLSSHHEWVSGKELPQCAPFYWSIEDGTALQGVATYPRGQLLKNLPTVVIPHGGPYWRDVVDLHINLSYRYMLASHGFLVLNPNYRGSQGRGNDFAKAARGGMGGLDYADIESMVEAAIKRGYANPNKVAIAGWSNGGYLSAWACTRPNSIWKTAIIGAGATDWGGMAICCDIPAAALDFAGSAPWTPRDPKSLFWCFTGKKTFLLRQSKRTREDLKTELGTATEIVKMRQAEVQVAQSLLEEAAAALKSQEKEAKLAALCETAA
ncbi:hypothetical protein B0H14DRAFT_3515415 [Mycena olivaceomarginata]|nr:hypothetical protein B0H14DRAFT_3515415 [Mycena olivaceomarginata]